MDYSTFLQQVVHPNWMSAPDRWLWRRPDGMLQGFGTTWRERPGLANLLWLALDLPKPPTSHDACSNLLYMWVVLSAGRTEMGGRTLEEAAALLPLDQFARQRAIGAEAKLLVVMARRRLAHA